jgi:hypothetical protein
VFNGQPYAGAIGDTGGRARNLLYVPRDENDATVNFTGYTDTNSGQFIPFPVAEFLAWADRNDLKRGSIQKKGTLDEAWASDLDIRIQQEIPFFGGSKAKVYFDIENVLNMINDGSGSKRFYNTQDIQSAVGVVSADIDTGTNTYNFTSFNPPVEVLDTWDSLYRIQLGIRVDF